MRLCTIRRVRHCPKRIAPCTLLGMLSIAFSACGPAGQGGDAAFLPAAAGAISSAFRITWISAILKDSIVFPAKTIQDKEKKL